jgi:hypothetical protein
LRSQVLFSVDRYTQSSNFQNSSESNWTLLPKENLLPINCSTSVQNCKNYRDNKVFISRVQIEQINSVSDLVHISSSFCLTISTIINSISSLILGYGVFLSSKPYCNLWRSPWSNPCPKWSIEGFATRVSSSLSDHNSIKSVFLKSFE